MVAGNIALLACGSFNPPTIAHLRMMECARDFLERKRQATVVQGIMSPVGDQFAKPGLIAASHRLGMLRAATADAPWIQIDDWESSQATWSRTLSVLKHHRDAVREKLGDDTMRLMLVCGGDLIDSFKRILPDGRNLWEPADVTAIIRDFGLVIIDREGATPEKTLATVAGADKYPDNIVVVRDDSFPNGVSSTRLRAALAAGASIRYTTHDGVVAYIKQHGLYQKST